MKTGSIKFLTFAVALLATACSKELAIDDEEGGGVGSGTANSTLIVKTRSVVVDGDTTNVSFPINVYVFNASGKCVATQTIASLTDTLGITLKKGAYDVYALAGATAEAYDLPSQSEATPYAVVSLREDAVHGELMAGHAGVQMADGTSNTLLLAMKRKVLMLQSVAIKGVPDSAKAVSLTLSPLHSSLMLNGDYADGVGAYPVSLSKAVDGTWQNEAPLYLLEADGEAAITVSLTFGSNTKSYSYVSTDELKANYKVNITGTYKSNEFDLVGTIKGEGWAGEKNIEFEFMDDEEDIDDTPVVDPNTRPVVGCLYADNKAFVVDSTKNSNGTITYLMIATQRYREYQISGKTLADLQSWAEGKNRLDDEIDGTTGWRTPTLEEVKVLKNVQDKYRVYATIVGTSNMIANDIYIYSEGNSIGFWNLKSGETTSNVPSSVSYFCFTTITVSK